MTNKKLAETIHNSVWSASRNHITPFNHNEPNDWFDIIIGGGVVILMLYVLLFG
jgi:hypothetical protein